MVEEDSLAALFVDQNCITGGGADGICSNRGVRASKRGLCLRDAFSFQTVCNVQDGRCPHLTPQKLRLIACENGRLQENNPGWIFWRDAYEWLPSSSRYVDLNTSSGMVKKSGVTYKKSRFPSPSYYLICLIS